MPAEKEPVTAVLNKHGECQPLIELNNSFCGQNRIRLDKYVNVEAYSQQSMNDRLWSLQKQYELIYPQSISKECIHNFNFFACNLMFPGCDRSTSEFKLKKFCKESCIHFIKECSSFARFWKNMAFATEFEALDKMTVFNYSANPSRNAGDSPECLYYVENGNFAEEGMTMLDLPSCILRPDISGRKSFS